MGVSRATFYNAAVPMLLPMPFVFTVDLESGGIKDDEATTGFERLAQDVPGY
jgi:hypothetical protein